MHIEPTGGTIPYTFSLDGGATTLVGEFSDVPAGDYNVTITDARGCTFDVPFSITEPILLTAEATADTKQHGLTPKDQKLKISGSFSINVWLICPIWSWAPSS